MTAIRTTLAGRGLGSRIAYVIVRSLVHGLVRLLTRLRVDGREQLPTAGAYVLAPVHRSNMDTPIAAALTRRRLRFMGKDTLWKHRLPGWFLSALGGFPVTRGTADREALRRCIEVLEGGEPLVMFPEGTRQSGPVVTPLFDGAVYVAARAGVPIVPVGIGGSEAVMPVGSKMIRPHRVHVVVGEPIHVEGASSGRLSRTAVRETTAKLRVVLQALFDEAQAKAGVQPDDAAGELPAAK